MSSGQLLVDSLNACGLSEHSEKVGPEMYRLQWGSATVICAARESAIVAMAPLFGSLPTKDPNGFCRQLLAINATMGGTAAFAIQTDGSVVLQTGRGIEDLSPAELKQVLTTVGQFAHHYRPLLCKEYYE